MSLVFNPFTGTFDFVGTTSSGGSGTVTNIATTAPITGGPITTTGTIGITDAAADGTTKGAAAFTAADFNASSGVIALDYTNGQKASASLPGFLSSADWTTFNNKGSGSVTSVALTVPSIMAVSGSPITGAGTLAVTLQTETANTVFAGPTTGSAATPTFRALVAADIPAFGVGSDTQVIFNDAGTLAGDSGLTFNKTTNALTPLVLYAGGIIDDTTSGVVQLNGQMTVPLGAVFQAPVGILGQLTTSENTNAALEAGGYWDANFIVNHNLTGLNLGHDWSNRITIASGKTLSSYDDEYFGSLWFGPGTLTDGNIHDLYAAMDQTQVGTFAYSHYYPPDLSTGATLGTFHYITAEDLASLTVGTVKGFINYGAGKFVVDSAGEVFSNSTNLTDTATLAWLGL